MLLAPCGFAIVAAHAAEPVTPDDFNRAETHVNFETPDWEKVSRKKIRDGLLLMAGTLTGSKRMFGDVGEVDPVRN